jgi:putative transcriptional regulator
MNDIENFLNVKPTPYGLKYGRILVSVPFYNDRFFNRSVVLMTDYDDEACAGLVLNKLSERRYCDIFKSTKIDEPVYIGGPVMTNQLFGIHTLSGSKKSNELLPGVYAGYDAVLLALLEYHAIENLRVKFFMGYAGWIPGQLEQELENKMWVVGTAHPDLVFNTQAELIWKRAVTELGKEYQHWLEIPNDLSDN